MVQSQIDIKRDIVTNSGIYTLKICKSNRFKDTITIELHDLDAAMETGKYYMNARCY